MIGTGKYYSYQLNINQTRMMLKSDVPGIFDSAKTAVGHNRNLLEKYIALHPEFESSIEPMDHDPMAPEIIRKMMQAGLTANVGPMASVAGGLAEVATNAMLKHKEPKSNLALADNGGDISIKGDSEILVGIHTLGLSIADRVGFKIKADDLPLGICTSAGTLGHSISFGDSEAVIIFSRSAYLADAAATAVANNVKKTDPEGTIQNALEIAENIKGVLGCMIFIADAIGTIGRLPEIVEMVDLE